jgi:hypothetical protein
LTLSAPISLPKSDTTAGKRNNARSAVVERHSAVGLDLDRPRVVGVVVGGDWT